MSKFATRLSRAVIKHDLSDPMSGFFALRREVLELAVRDLSSIGFKILLDIIASSPQPLRVKEYPTSFVIVTPAKASWIARQYGVT